MRRLIIRLSPCEHKQNLLGQKFGVLMVVDQLAGARSLAIHLSFSPFLATSLLILGNELQRVTWTPICWHKRAKALPRFRHSAEATPSDTAGFVPAKNAIATSKDP
jgi:hypothetical protein